MESDARTGSGDRVDTGRAWFGTAIAVLGLVAAGWVASAWIDEPPDGTCSSVWHPDTWRDIPSCTTPMVGRTLLALLLFVGAVVVYLVAWRLWRPSALVARYAALALLVASALAVVHTEFVRSGGVFASDGPTLDGPGPPIGSITTAVTVTAPSLDPP
jgi:hypothetical protein